MYELSKNEFKNFQKIENTYYMKPALALIEKKVSVAKNKKNAWKELFNNLYEVLVNSKLEVDNMLEERLENGEIRDIGQARKSIAGNAFSNLVYYTFINNKLVENIRPDIYISSKKSEIKNFDEIATINVGNETQKPDVDLVIYTIREDENVKNCIILSLKTSLRERAGQTYKWKLLMEIATTDNVIKKKYDINYNPENMPLVCFATVNFYNEINNPQHKGMFKFFDNSFIGKPIDTDFIRSLSNIVDYANSKL